MTVVYGICFVLLTVGILLILKLNSDQLTEDLSFLFHRKRSLRERSLRATGKKKPNRLMTELQKMKSALEETGKEKQFSVALAASLLLMLGGCAVAVLVGNYFLIPVLSLAFAMLPYAYLKRTVSVYDAQVKGELETALSIITTSYVRSDNLINAVKENLQYLKPPVKGIFEGFVTEATTITPDMKLVISHLREKISDSVFSEWCDTLIACQNDRTLKDTLMPVVSKLTDVRLVNNSLTTMLAEVRREYDMMVLLLLSNIPLLYVLNQEWYNALMNTTLGKLVLAICGGIIIVTSVLMNRYTAPIEYKR